MITKYNIHTDTAIIFSYFESGYEYSRVLEGKSAFLVRQSPDGMVRESSLHAGSDLEGATKSDESLSSPSEKE